ncbi:hypothetical protein HNQ56_002947 [Anaerotaenia torta]|uniref:hypothetical protein n=1 Tax=Anaerotaenia torta TaxID=433293 RepID=UPI003D24E0DA
MKKRSKVLSLLLCLIIVLTGCKASNGSDNDNTTPTAAPTNAAADDGGSSDAEVPSGEPVVIKWGHNWSREMDTNFMDPVTGESSLGEEELNARRYAEQQVLEKLNAKIEFVQYPTDLTECILQSVLAGDPIADIVRVTNGSQGQILAQNVLQPIDEYADLFSDPDDSWMYWGKVYGHNYFLNNVMRFGGNELLCYNIGMIKKVEALKVDGKTKYPADYFAEGNWTWSVFEDYLQKINDHFKQEWDGYRAYQTDYRSAALYAIYANGGEVYGDNGLGMNTEQAKVAVSFIDSLIQKGLMFSENQYNGNADVVGLMDTWRFQWGHSAFVNLPQWLAGDMVGQFADRGDAMGYVPFPRPDGVAADDPSYRQLNDATDCYAIPKGVSKEKAELAIKVFKEYTSSYHKKMANSDKAMDYIKSDASIRNAAVRLNLDITNEEYGANIFKAFQYLSEDKNIPVNDYGKMAGIYDLWSHDILGYSLYGVNGSPKYAVQAEARMNEINDLMSNYSGVLSSAEIIDNVKPKFTTVEGPKLEFAAGTDPAAIDWKQYNTAADNLDGELDMANAVVDYSEIDFNTVGKYDGKLHYTIQDAAGNEGTDSKSVVIYDGNNTTPPTLVVKAADAYRTIKLNEDTAQINWKDDFVETAADKDGLDIKGTVSADLSELDTTTAGEYNVALTVTDYAGNTAAETIIVQVVKE